MSKINKNKIYVRITNGLVENGLVSELSLNSQYLMQNNPKKSTLALISFDASNPDNVEATFNAILKHTDLFNSLKHLFENFSNMKEFHVKQKVALSQTEEKSTYVFPIKGFLSKHTAAYIDFSLELVHPRDKKGGLFSIAAHLNTIAVEDKWTQTLDLLKEKMLLDKHISPTNESVLPLKSPVIKL